MKYIQILIRKSLGLSIGPELTSGFAAIFTPRQTSWRCGTEVQKTHHPTFGHHTAILLMTTIGLLLSGRVHAQSVSRPAHALSADTLTYQGVTLQPGDVIDFLGGGVTKGGFLVYGHAGLYLGVDLQTHQKMFLDFTITKYDSGIAQPGFPLPDNHDPKPFFGRILNETDFLTENARSHEGFDVFRLKNNPPVTQEAQEAMFREAKRISNTESFALSGEVCSSAVAAVLAKGTGASIDAFTTDDLATGQFARHPQLGGKSIAIKAALREANARADNVSQGGSFFADIQSINASTRNSTPLETQQIEADRQVKAAAIEQRDREASESVGLWMRAQKHVQALAKKACSSRSKIRDEDIGALTNADVPTFGFTFGRFSRCEWAVLYQYETFRETGRNATARDFATWVQTYNVGEYLRTVARLACSNPDALEKLGSEGKAPGVGVSRDYLEWAVHRHELDQPENECHKQILEAMLEADNLIPGPSVIAMGRRYRLSHPTLLHLLTTTVGDFLGDLGKTAGNAVSSLGHIFPPGYTQASDDSSEDGNDRHSPDNWASLNQLRGFKGF